MFSRQFHFNDTESASVKQLSDTLPMLEDCWNGMFDSKHILQNKNRIYFVMKSLVELEGGKHMLIGHRRNFERYSGKGVNHKFRRSFQRMKKVCDNRYQS